MDDIDDLLAAAVLLAVFVNLAYVALRLRKDIRNRDSVFIAMGIIALLVALLVFAAGGFVWWLEYSDFSIGW